MPAVRPARPYFSSGPCAKRPGWTPEALQTRAARALASLQARQGQAQRSRSTARATLLGIPADYRIGIVPASDTGAVEMALWSLLGARGRSTCSPGKASARAGSPTSIKQLKLKDARVLKAPLRRAARSRDRSIPTATWSSLWNGTTSGVRVPNGDWIAADREGLTICDATSAAFAMDLPWDKLDVVTFSWQKVLGGEAAHGMLVLSPRAVARLESYTPPWPMPKIFRMTKGGKLIEGIFEGETINTPSMLAVEDDLDALKWAEGVGGLQGLIARCRRQSRRRSIAGCENATGSISSPSDPAIRSNTSRVPEDRRSVVHRLPADEHRRRAAKKIASLLEKEGVALRRRRLSRRAAGPAHLVRRDGRAEPMSKR